jgi:HlyD family secretion protein
VKQGMDVRFTVDAYPDRDFNGKIRLVRLNPTIQQNVVTYNVIVDVTNEGNVLKPGMTAQVSFVANQRADVLRIPNAALRFRPVKDEKADRNANAKENTKDDKKKTEAAKPETTANERAGDRIKRPPSRVYKVDAKGELATVEVRTGVASNQHTEIIAGEIKAGDELVIRDLQDKNAKK